MQLSDTQLGILNAAAQRDDGNVLPLPGSLRGGAQMKVLDALLKRGLIDKHQGHPDAEPSYHISRDGLAAINVAPEDAPRALPSATEGAQDASKAKAGRKPRAGKKAAPAAPKAKGAAKAAPTPRTGTKQEKLISMLRTKDGASIDEVAAETGLAETYGQGSDRRHPEEEAWAGRPEREGRGPRYGLQAEPDGLIPTPMIRAAPTINLGRPTFTFWEPMVRLVAKAPVSCVLNGERTHDRQVGWCSVGGADLGAQLIRGGFCARCAAYDAEQRYVRVQHEAGPWPGGFPGYCR